MRILYLDLDTLRPDHLGCYGYERNTSPNIDSIAKQGVTFTNCFCSDAPCLPSRTALMSGRFGIHTGVVGHGGTAADFRIEGEKRGFADALRRESLPALLRSAGMKTVLVSPFAERHSSWSFYAGFSEMHNTGFGGLESAESVTPTALDWIQRNASKADWYLHVNYWDPHTPYRAPEEFSDPFKDDPLPSWITEDVLDAHQQAVGPHTAQEVSMYDDVTDPRYPRHPGAVRNMADLRRMIDGYDCGVKYMDSHIGQLFKELEKQGVMDDIAIIISADHGENMGEFGIYGEHATADYATCRIPMVIRWPNCRSGHIDDGMHYNLDLLPTIAELLGKPAGSTWDGRSYASAILEGTVVERDFLVVSQCAHVCQRGVRFGPWMYIRTYHDGFHLFPDEMLFNINEDPHEQRDLASLNPEVCMKAVYLLNQWHDQMMKSMDHDVDPMWTVIKEGGPSHAKGYLRKYCERLNKTGRGWAVEELLKRHPKEIQ